MKIRLLREKPYTVSINNQQHRSLKVSLHRECGLTQWQRVYEAIREDGVILLIPEKVFNSKDFELEE